MSVSKQKVVDMDQMTCYSSAENVVNIETMVTQMETIAEKVSSLE